MKTHLFFTDTHIDGHFDMRRVARLATLIKKVKPDVVICGGDHFDFHSLSDFKTPFDPNTFKEELEYGLYWLNSLWRSVTATKKKTPERVFLFGNHEHRLDAYLNKHPELEGVIGDGVLKKKLMEMGWHVVPWIGETPGYKEIDGIIYAHYITSGAACKPISSQHLASAIADRTMKNTVVGHSHLLDVHHRYSFDGKPVTVVSGGCYLDPYEIGWAGQHMKQWWNGVIVLHVYENGAIDVDMWSHERMVREFGDG